MIKVSIDRQVMQNVMSGVADQLKSKIDLNLNHVKKLCKDRYGIETIVGVENKDANIVVFKDQIGCRLGFEVRFPMSVLITTKESPNNTLPENNDISEELNEIPEELEYMRGELEKFFAEEYDFLTEELDKLLAGEPDVIWAELDMSELKEERLIQKDKKRVHNLHTISNHHISSK